MPSERRQYRRIPVGASVSFQELTFERDVEPAQSRYLDVSGGGLLLSSPRELALGTLLKLEVRVPGWGRHQNRFNFDQNPDQRPLVAVGQVVRVEAMEDGAFELGIKFINVYPDDQAALLKFVEANTPSESNP